MDVTQLQTDANMSNYVTIETFDANKLTTGELFYVAKMSFIKIPILYKYSNVDGPLVIRTPILNSIGVLELKDGATQQVTNYSMTFLGFKENEGIRREEKEFMRVIKEIEAFCANVVKEKETELVAKRNKRLLGSHMSIFKYNLNKPDASPIIFAKLFTNNSNITTPFYRKKTKKDVKVSGNVVSVPALDYVKQKCKVIGGILVQNIFVGNIGESIQIKCAESIIVQKVDSTRSIIGADLDLGPEESGSETEEDKEKKDEVAPKPKKEIIVKPGNKRKHDDGDDDVDEDEDDIEKALNDAVKRR